MSRIKSESYSYSSFCPSTHHAAIFAAVPVALLTVRVVAPARVVPKLTTNSAASPTPVVWAP